MKIECKISRSSDGQWQAAHISSQVGDVSVRAATRDEAIEKLRGEIRYRLELCPCTGETYRHIDLDVVDVS